jgi:hypothetical protein
MAVQRVVKGPAYGLVSEVTLRDAAWTFHRVEAMVPRRVSQRSMVNSGIVLNRAE